MSLKFSINRHSNSVNGVLTLFNRGFFYKMVKSNDFKKELAGFLFLKKYYPVAKLVFAKKITSHTGLFIFIYEKSVGRNRGLLIDAFTSNKKSDHNLNQILHMYRKVFTATLCKDYGVASDAFFKDRVATRLRDFYPLSFAKLHSGRMFCINHLTTKLDFGGITDSITDFFKHRTKKWCVASQCDPTDLNIGLKPIVFDYLVGGLNPLMAEFAIFFWQNLIQGGYLSPRYYPEVFREHNEILHRLDMISSVGRTITHEISEARVHFISNYIDVILQPILSNINYSDWYYDFKNFLALRILGVTNLNKMTEQDKNISLAYLSLFYNNTFQHLDNFRDFITHLCQKRKN